MWIRESKPIISGIYSITHVESGRKYIGSSVDINKRWGNHLSLLNRNLHKNLKLQNSWNTHSPEAFLFEIVEDSVQKDELISREQFYLDSMTPYYNIIKKAGSSAGKPWSEEAKTAHSAIMKAVLARNATIVQCAICEKPVRRSPSRIKRAKFIVCSKSCGGKMNTLLNKGKEGRKHEAEQKTKFAASMKNLYSSAEYEAKHYVWQPCIECGTPIKIPAYDVKVGKAAKYCSWACRGKARSKWLATEEGKLASMLSAQKALETKKKLTTS